MQPVVTVPLPEAARIAHVAYPVIDYWVTAGIVPASLGGRGRHHERRVDAVGLLTAVVISRLRDAGLELRAIRPIAAFLAGHGEASLNAAFRRGKCRLVCAAGRPPQLVSASCRPNRSQSASFFIDAPLESLYRNLSAAIEKEARNAN